MGEFTIASSRAFHTFPTYIQYINETQAYPAAARHADELRDHLGGDALAAPDRAARRAAHGARWGSGADGAYLELQELRRVVRRRDARSRASTSRSRPASSSRCSARAAAARRPRCGSSPASTGPTSGRIVVDGKDITRHAAQPARHGDGLPGVQPLPEHDGGAERRVRPQDPQASRRPTAARGCASCSSSSGSATPASAIRISSRAACSSASRSPGRSRSSRACCCSTSRSRRSTRRCACSCARRSAASSSSSGSRRIYVTHDQEEALSISDRVAVMYGGKIEQIGAPAEMYGSPATPFVAEFIGTMNRLVATVGDDGAIDYAGLSLRVDAARGLPRGERVLCLVRPETVRHRARERRPTPDSAVAGEVISHTFLGSIDARAGRGRRAASGRSPRTSRPRRRRRSRSARTSSRASRRRALGCSAWPSSQSCQRSIRKITEDPVDAERLQLEQSRRVVDRVDERLQTEPAGLARPRARDAGVVEADRPGEARGGAGSTSRSRRAARCAATAAVVASRGSRGARTRPRPRRGPSSSHRPPTMSWRRKSHGLFSSAMTPIRPAVSSSDLLEGRDPELPQLGQRAPCAKRAAERA